MHRILSSIIILSSFLITFSGNIRHVISTNSSEQPVIDVSPFIRIYKDGRVERLLDTLVVPPSFDPKTNVESKDTLYSPEHHLYVRLYLPKATHQNQKLPLLVYFHGGAFLIGNASNPAIHGFLNLLVSEAKIIAVSVDYRLAPEHPVPAAYNDSWTALKWVASHVNRKGPEDWLNRHADFQRVFLCGDSAGANIAHQMALKHGHHQEKLEGVNTFRGMILCHPYFWGNHSIPGETKLYESNRAWGALLWKVACPSSSGVDDPWMNPAKDPNLGGLGSTRVQVFVSEKDYLRERGWYYGQKLRESGWSGDMEVVEYKGEGHVFHLANLTSKHSVDLRHRIVSFINH
ncbi:hypothetical protein ACOSP7_005322 [Xanthoceras sorbifolium]|uniref:Alpha/beta hydrolase fold-3 domain-containing protein n=1 Tax=Xanthoceras sorbifolium TaxID=99658 RepID=A0ABQ8IG66_9ROSI|nr:hypothetical protein JRO89_XS02G0064200 [Xanthoceras sorbifolium]KAH7575221.1 hypothetical protein JRO89_XS02G0064600 [Xanthoceras sorbifolium]